jgi:hypothetical protein
MKFTAIGNNFSAEILGFGRTMREKTAAVFAVSRCFFAVIASALVHKQQYTEGV